MGATYKPHKCAREGCNVITKNKTCCSKECSALLQTVIKPGPPKECQKCGKMKPGEEFLHKTPAGKLKTRVWCADCCSKLKNHQEKRQKATNYQATYPIIGERDMASEVLAQVPYSALWRGKGMTTAYSPLINADVFVGY